MDDKARLKRQLVYLTGFMGSGKSTIGPILANTLGFEYVDVDKLIEEMSNKRIVDIFGEEGEQSFRAMERAALERLMTREHCVVSLGGGTIANEQNFQLIHGSGIVIYLQLSPEEILERVRHRSDRPLLRDAAGNPLTPPQLEQKVKDMLGMRSQFYSRADIIIPSDSKRVGHTVDEIVRRLRGYV
ncbi:MAG TPA: shikimate kinase [Bacteroidota bacterium]|nr:shikimate kinase [Bacteroidota bacterium]